MTITVTDPDFNFSELDWKSFRYTRYFRSGISGELGLWESLFLAL